MIETADILPIANEPTTGTMREHLMGALARVQPNVTSESPPPTSPPTDSST